MDEKTIHHEADTELFGPPAAPPPGRASITIAGLIVMYASVASFAGVGFLLYLARSASVDPSHAVWSGQTGYSALLQYGPEFLLCAIGAFTGFLGVKLLRAGGLSPSDPLPVVNRDEWKVLSAAITSHQDDPVGQYIRLSSLTGATGLFTKLGLSGLPLATIGLTLFFAAASMLGGGVEFLKLTQLTLGAFIGSFVQKQVGALRDAAANSAPAPAPSPGTGATQEPGKPGLSERPI